ncbi:YbaN family protein [Rhizobium sp. ARZ01]|uniref:YbaN family protein n=1 Tax=Rhizobium sp. ARZ01 TaxID=2769313 RepID=UPI0017809E6B|nr:YbaN family protein [Rhizobium sp. ARZ01]MBD9372704.1 YbaN family protein [Rhizobium sp. ARZ01]
MRILCLCLGWLMVALAIAGVFLPLLPTTPFLLLAAGLFARSSPRFEHWLLNHPLFGDTLRRWRENGAISTRAKSTSVALIVASYALFVLFGSPSAMLAAIVATVMIFPVLFILSRPGG